MPFRRDVIVLPNLLCALAVSGLAGLGKDESLPDVAEPLSVLRAVGPEGGGNAAASTAWKRVTAGEVSVLVSILTTAGSGKFGKA